MLNTPVLIQTKPKPAGEPRAAVQFLGDPGVHPDIFWDTDSRTKPHWRVRTSDERGSQWIDIGYWLIGAGHNLETVSPAVFARDWQQVGMLGPV